jgi:hypothetical protein
VNGYFFEIGDYEGLSCKILDAKELKFDGFSYIEENFSLKQMVSKSVKVYEELIRRSI